MKKFISYGSVLALAISSLALAIPAQAVVTPTWDVNGSFGINVEYASVNYPETLVLVQGGTSITGGTLNTVPPAAGSAFTVTSGSVIGSAIEIYAQQDISTLVVHLSGTIAADGTMSGTWADVAPGTRVGTWATTSGAANVTPVAPDWGSQLSASRCVGKVGSPVINVTEKVINDVDSGIAGNYWAVDNYVRHIQVWQIGKVAGTYCALVTYEGASNAVAGQTGPGGSGTIGTGVSAEMKGGRRAVIVGTLLTTPLWKTKGSVGTVDYACDLSGNCPGYVSFLGQYFASGATFTDSWWGWFYYAGDHGSWLNSIEGNAGNIL